MFREKSDWDFCPLFLLFPFALPSWGTIGGPKRRKERDEGQQQAEQEYMEMLQTKLLKSKKRCKS